VDPVENKLAWCTQKWLNLVGRMEDIRQPKLRPVGGIRSGQLLNRIRDGYMRLKQVIH